MQGTKAVLGIGHSDGSVVLKSVFDGLPRFEVQSPFPIARVSWRPTCTLRPSKNPLNPGVPVQTEDMVVGDDVGNVYYYVVEWPMNWEVTRDTWPGSVSLIAKISDIHVQQVCGLSWSPDGRMFATGGNDNLCCLFEVDCILKKSRSLPARAGNRFRPSYDTYTGVETRVTRAASQTSTSTDADERKAFVPAEMHTLPSSIETIHLGPGTEKHR